MKKKIVKCSRTSSTKLHIRIFNVLDIAKTSWKYTKGKNAHAERAQLLFLFVKYEKWASRCGTKQIQFEDRWFSSVRLKVKRPEK